jgi:hypothetical protein
MISIIDGMPEVGQVCLIKIPVASRYNIENGTYKGDGVWVGAWMDNRGVGCSYKVSEWMPLSALMRAAMC